MNRETLFEEFINECERDSHHWEFCGQGNPNADILLIGQEPASRINVDNQKKIHENHELCRNKDTRDCPRPKRNEYTGKTNTTWQNYQRLINKIYGPSGCKDKYDFEKYAFTTELGNVARMHSKVDVETRTAIQNRLELIKSSDFIQSFPVIILACGPYIKNTDSNKEIDETFEVEFDGYYKNYGKGVWFYSHHNTVETKFFAKGEKLVIHTKQFSYIVPNLFLDDMVAVIKKHLNIK